MDNVFETMSVVDDNAVKLRHKDVLTKLVQEPSVSRVFAPVPWNLDVVELASLDKDQYTFVSSQGSFAGSLNQPCSAPFVQTRLQRTDTSVDSSEVSSVMLSPLVQVPVMSFSTACTRTTCSKPVASRGY